MALLCHLNQQHETVVLRLSFEYFSGPKSLGYLKQYAFVTLADSTFKQIAKGKLYTDIGL